MPTLTLPPALRVIALEDARDWLNTAIAETARGDTAAAVYAAHVAIGHATEARDKLIYQLVPVPEEET